MDINFQSLIYCIYDAEPWKIFVDKMLLGSCDPAKLQKIC